MTNGWRSDRLPEIAWVYQGEARRRDPCVRAVGNQIVTPGRDAAGAVRAQGNGIGSRNV